MCSADKADNAQRTGDSFGRVLFMPRAFSARLENRRFAMRRIRPEEPTLRIPAPEVAAPNWR